MKEKKDNQMRGIVQKAQKKKSSLIWTVYFGKNVRKR